MRKGAEMGKKKAPTVYRNDSAVGANMVVTEAQGKITQR